MKKLNVVITGGCGFLGRYLIKELLNREENVKIGVIDRVELNENFPDFMYDERVLYSKKDITKEKISDDIKGAEIVFHLAGMVSFFRKDKFLLEKVNVQGTRNVLKSCLEAKVNRFIHVSSVAALGYNDKENDFVNERFKFDWKIARKRKKHYMLTKHYSDFEAKNYREIGKEQDMGVSIVYPGLMFGKGDKNNSLRYVKAIYERKIPFNMPGGTNIIDVRDVARGLVDVMEKGRIEEDYILSGWNLGFKKINKVISDIVGVKAPRLTFPKSDILNFFAYYFFSMSELFLKNSEVSADNIDSSFKFRYFDNTKAYEDFLWQPEISFNRTVRDVFEWMKQDGYV
jgi:dihydroflavonol-4-reductase